MEHPTISIIVPVYRVEAYLRRCLDSLLVQTYPNLQIILVDDGSPDRCGTICDEYAAKDSRIAVIHQKNQGISAARNAALDRAEGQWIGFVDSDDWIEPDMYEKLLQAVLTHDADIAVCGATIHIADREIPYGCTPETVWDRETTIHQHIRNRDLHNEVWSKLWRRELFDELRFPVGVLFEDLALMWKLFHRAERVAVIPNALYHYRKNNSSITMTHSLEKSFCTMQLLRERNRGILAHYPETAKLLQESELLQMKKIWAYAWLDRKNLTPQRVSEMDAMALFCKSIWKNKDYPLSDRAGVLLTLYNHPAFHLLCGKLLQAYLYFKYKGSL